MKAFVYIALASSVIGLAVLDFNVSAVSRIDSMAEFSQAIRNYTSKLNLSAAQDFPYNVPSFAAVHVMKELNDLSVNMKYREVSNNPSNRQNLANDHEKKIIMGAKKSVAQYGFSSDIDHIYLIRYDPIYVKESCLSCHGKVENASAQQHRHYGKKTGYGYKEGDLYGVKVISIDITWFLIRYLAFLVIFVIPVIMWFKGFDKKLTEALNVDSLSGAYNKNYYLKSKDRLIDNGYVLLFDVDDFKNINDTYGHTCGDNVIWQVCELIKSKCRKTDMLFRFGGEEFVLFLKGINSKERVISIVGDIMTEISAHEFVHEGIKFNVTVSIGICKKAPSISTEDAISKADLAMYDVKKHGKNNFKFAD
ncbi:diguanylate cyclase [Vibrio sp. THAF190c]|uniref:diguanylate cyclase n=1 Tax=Vibrio sp. THAF190c TaxID=2587865 RepID=UPI001267E86A|nr:diguanylate cyclase [Vibrio sp. THAF190c]QFT13492.1 Diguanylate cyclase YdeH [Vibrio sp. THAF190c]